MFVLQWCPEVSIQIKLNPTVQVTTWVFNKQKRLPWRPFSLALGKVEMHEVTNNSSKNREKQQLNPVPLKNYIYMAQTIELLKGTDIEVAVSPTALPV